MAKIKGKDLKQAPVTVIEFGGKERKLTFDFNTLCELQDFYADPFVAVTGVASGDFSTLRALLFASLKSGHMIDSDEEFDMTIGQVGRELGYIIQQDKELYEKIFETILEGVTLFFPTKEEGDKEQEGNNEGDPKN